MQNLPPSGPPSLPYRDAVPEPRVRHASPTHAPPAGGSLFTEYFHIAFRSRLLIVATALLGAAAGVIWTLPQAPVYHARTSLDIQGLNENFLNIRSVDPMGQTSASSPESAIQTQIKLLESESMLRRTVSKLEKQDLHPAGKKDAISRWLGHSLGSSTPSLNDALWTIAHHIKVKPLGATRLIEVTCESTDPKLAAPFCNTLATEFIQQSYEVRFETAQTTSEWLSRQLTDLRGKQAASEAKLQSYAQQGEFLFSPDKESVPQEKLRQLQEELSRAQADRITKQAQFEMSNRASPDQLPMVLDNGPLKDYQVRLTDLRRQYAELSGSLTAEAPRLKKLQLQIDELQSSMIKERNNIIGRMRVEFESAKHREALLQPAYHAQEKTVTDQVAKASQINLLRREVESGRQFYDTMLQKVKEAGFASALRASPIRVVDTASDPDHPIGPHRGSSTLVGLMLGGLLGVVISVARHRGDRKLRSPGDAANYLHFRELGVIPSANLHRRMLAIPGRRSSEPLELTSWTSKSSLSAESFRVAMSSVLFGFAPGGGGKTVVVTSPVVSEGKTTVASNLGIAAAETGRKVLLIDGDLRKPRLDKIFSIENQLGLRDVLAGKVPVDDRLAETVTRPTRIPQLWVTTSGTAKQEVASLLHSAHLEPMLERLRSEFDLILIDTPPLLHMADARLLGRAAQEAVLVFRSAVTTLDTAAQAQKIMHDSGIPVTGVILNDFNPSREAHQGYYKSYFEYQKGEKA